jgi:hydroxyacylglutathione hydrolase
MMFFYRKTVPGLAIYSYIIGDENIKECLVIDPIRDVEEYIGIANENHLIIKQILETHVHADFISGAAELKSRLNGLPKIYCSGMGGEEWTPDYADHIVKEGDEIKVGSLLFKAVHTPGHTPEHVMWVLYDKERIRGLFTGDFLFVGDVGRPDLLGKEEMKKLSHQLYQSIFNKLKPYPDYTEVFPAHGKGSLCGKSLGSAPSSTLGKERNENPSLQEKPESGWIEDLLKEMPPVPKYFPRIKKINISGAPLIGSKKVGSTEFSPEQIKEARDKGAVILDVRCKEAFAHSHIPGSINIPFSAQLPTWAGWILPEDTELILVLEDVKNLSAITTSLMLIGFDKIQGFLEGIAEWEKMGMEIEGLIAISSKDLYELKQQKPEHYILDVRTLSEWKAGHIEGAVHIHAGLVQDNLDKLPKERHISVICGSGFRASMVASLLKRAGIKDVSNVFGGMTSWKEEGYPTVSG